MNEIVVSEYKPEYREEWENFVESSNNGTMFHKQAFLDYHPEGRFGFYHLMFRRNGELIAVLPGGLKENGTVFWSPVGASYGSFVAKDIHYELAQDIVDSFMDFCRQKGIKEAFLIPPPLIYSLNYSQHFEYAMLFRKFDFELHYISHAIDLKHGSNFLEHFDKTARKTCRKILRENQISIVESDDYEAFNHILVTNKAKHDCKPTHTLEDMLRIRDLMPDNVKLLMVYHEGIPIGGSWLFYCNRNVVLCFYNMLLYEYEHLKPVYLINYEVVRQAVEGGYTWVDIGVSQDTKAEDPMTPSLNLIQYKERFGARGILRSTFHYKFSD